MNVLKPIILAGICMECSDQQGARISSWLFLLLAVWFWLVAIGRIVDA